MADGRRGGVQRLAGLDGLRGLAVLAVVLYHLDLSGVVEAGFLGVDVFFTISGFIITALLLREHALTGRIDWRAFLARRMLRLFPAAAAMVFLGAAITLAYVPDAGPRITSDIPAAFTYASNWWQIASQQSYFEAMGRPPVLQHLWSLAIEEQYYLAWPLLFIALMRWHGARGAGVIALLLALASTAWMALLYLLDGDAASRNRIYLGSDTHAMGLLAGSALACFVVRFDLLAPQPPRHRGWLARLRSLAALAAFAALAWIGCTWNDATPSLYAGGFLAVSVLTGLVVLAAVDRASIVARVLSLAPLHWLGTRSYSLYLWHWPIFVWLRHPAGGPGRSLAWTVAELALVAYAGELSYRLLENWKRPASPARPRPAFAAWAYSVLLLPLCALVLAVRTDTVTPAPAKVQAIALAPAEAQPLLEAVRALASVEAAVAPAAMPATAPTATTVLVPGGQITVIGDSVMLGARPYLTPALGANVDAVVGRQFSEGLKVVNQLRARAALTPIVVVHLGTNGYIVESQAREMLRQLGDRQQVVVLNVKAERRWTAFNNAVLERVAAERPNVTLVRWDIDSRDHPEYFVQDGIHLTGAGIVALTSAVARATGVAVAEGRLPRRHAAGRMVRTGSTTSLGEALQMDQPEPAALPASAPATQEATAAGPAPEPGAATPTDSQALP